MESTVLFMISWLIFLLSKNAFYDLRFYNLLKISLIFSFLVLLKPFYAYLPFLFIILILFKKRGFIIFLKSTILILMPVFTYYGWCYINFQNTGYFAPTSIYGLLKAQNCVYFAEKTPNEFNWISEPYVKFREKSIQENKDVAMSIWYAYEDGAYRKHKLTFQQLSSEFGKFAEVAIFKNPFDYLKQIIFRSWFDFWKPTIYWNYDKFNFKYANKIFLGIWYLQYVILLFFRLIFILLIPYYLVKFIKNSQLTILFFLTIIVFVSSILQAVVTYGNNDRYSFPFEFIMIMVVFLFLKI